MHATGSSAIHVVFSVFAFSLLCAVWIELRPIPLRFTLSTHFHSIHPIEIFSMSVPHSSDTRTRITLGHRLRKSQRASMNLNSFVVRVPL